MEKRDTFSQLFFIKRNKPKSNGNVPIYLRISINRKVTELSLHYDIKENLWDKISGRAIGNSKKSKEINNYIMSVSSSIYENYKYIRETKQIVNPIDIKNRYLGIVEERKSIIKIYQEHNDSIKQLEGIDYSPNTVQRYETSLRHTKNFILYKFQKTDLLLEDINQKFISDYEIFLKTERRCSHNTTIKYLKNFKKIIRIALANNWLKIDPFLNYKMRLKKVDRPFLNDEELEILIKKKFHHKRIEQVKDCFIFSCFTGLAYYDLKELKPKNISIGEDGKLWIKINRKKTNGESHIPILPITAQLIEKYKNNPYCLDKGVLMPVISNQRMNAYLKEIADICSIDKNLTSHTARHTFATTVTLNNDVPIETVSKMLGHSSIKMTNIYARLLDKKVSRDMNHLNDKYNISI